MARILDTGILTGAELGRDIGRAVAWDIRDNPNLSAHLDDLIRRHGGKARGMILKILKDEAAKALRGDPGPALFPWFRSAVETTTEGEAWTRQFGLGIWGALITAVTTAASSIYTAKVTATAQKDVAKIQARAAEADAAARKAEAQAQSKAAEAAMQSAVGPRPAEAGILPAGLPGWILPVAGAGLLIFFFLTRKG